MAAPPSPSPVEIITPGTAARRRGAAQPFAAPRKRACVALEEGLFCDVDLANVLVYHEDAQVIAAGIEGKHDETEFLRIVRLRCAGKLLAVFEDNHSFAAMLDS